MSDFFHVYNRGVDRRTIFHHREEFERFINRMEAFRVTDDGRELIRIHAYCLMKNHFHLLIEQRADKGMASFMHRLGTGYTLWFNARHDRNGSLFGTRYKRKLVIHEEYFAHLPVYIHANALDVVLPEWITSDIPTEALLFLLRRYPWSSFSQWAGEAGVTTLDESLFGSYTNHIGLLRTYIMAKRLWPSSTRLLFEDSALEVEPYSTDFVT